MDNIVNIVLDFLLNCFAIYFLYSMSRDFNFFPKILFVYFFLSIVRKIVLANTRKRIQKINKPINHVMESRDKVNSVNLWHDAIIIRSVCIFLSNFV